MKKELETLLKTPISGVTYGGSYITSNPKLLGGRGGGVDHQQRLRLILTPGAHAERGLAVVGRLAVGHLQRGDAQRPDVCL